MPVSHPPGAAAPAPSRSSDSLNLPDPRHAQRVPPHIGRAQLERIRRAAFLLPQVVTPADYSDDAGNPTVQLDRLGLVLLQKAAAGARPSRWIDPALMDSALAHLEVVGSGGTTLPQMLERRAALEANGVVREGGGFVREVQKPLSVPVPEGRPWSITVAFRVPVDAELAWAFHRSGNLEALRAELGAPPPHPQAEDLRAHLAALVARSHAYQPRRLELLLPRLQAECAAPVPLPAMKAACTRAQDRWEHRVTELDMLEGLNSELAFQRYPDSFETARHLQRSADGKQMLVACTDSNQADLIDLATRKGAIAAKADRYPVTRLPTRFLAVTGEGRIEIDGSRTAITGDLKADAGWFGIPAAAPPSLSDDVIVERGRPVEAAPVTERIRLDLRVDLGEQLYFEGRGLSTRLAGSLRHTGDIGPALRTTGTIRAVGGTLDAYGRKLTLERGALNFQGPIDNPGLNVLALRKGLAVEAGVEVTGTVSRPRARLVSSPDVPEAEKLAWLVLGRGRGEISAADAATLVGAANALVGGDVLPAGRLLRGLGLDELNFGSEEGGALGTLPQSTVAGRTGSASAAEVVSVGKQLTENIHVSYRQGLADAEGSLRVALQFSKSLQFILRAGSDPGVDAVYRFTFE